LTPEIADPAFLEPILHLVEHGAVDLERDVVHAALHRSAVRLCTGLRFFIGKDGDQTAIAGIKSTDALRRIVQIW